jgi:hypothetical protein
MLKQEMVAKDCHRKRKTKYAHFILARSWQSHLGRRRLGWIPSGHHRVGFAPSPLIDGLFHQS